MRKLEVKIYIPKNRTGDLYVYIYDPERQEIQKKLYKGINSYPDFEDRLFAAQDLAKATELSLKSGWKPKKKSALPTLQLKVISIGEAGNVGLKYIEEKISKGTFVNYRCMVNFYNKAVKDLGWIDEPVSDLQPHHIETILLKIKGERSWTNKEYNRQRINLQSLFRILVQKFYIKDNPVTKVPTLQSERKQPYIPLTPKEQTIVIDHFKKYLPNFNIWLKSLYHTGLRPGELRQMKCSMVDIEQNLLVLPPELIKTDTKRIIPIPLDLKKDLAKFDLSDPEAYVFGRWRKGGDFNEKDFQPSKIILGVNTANYIWKNQVIKILGIPKFMYSNKHKKANDSIEDGVSLEAVQRLFGHSTPITTEIYAQILQLANFKQITEKAREYK